MSVDREPKFHVFAEGDSDWNDVEPGDAVVAPGTMAFKAATATSTDVNESLRVYILRYAPFFVVEKIDRVLSIDTEFADRYTGLTTFRVFSRHGMLLILK